MTSIAELLVKRNLLSELDLKGEISDDESSELKRVQNIINEINDYITRFGFKAFD